MWVFWTDRGPRDSAFRDKCARDNLCGGKLKSPVWFSKHCSKLGELNGGDKWPVLEGLKCVEVELVLLNVTWEAGFYEYRYRRIEY